MLPRHILLLSALISIGGAYAREAGIAVTNCPEHTGDRVGGEQQSSGPFKLASAHRIEGKGLPGLTSPAVSPDGSSFAWLRQDEVAIADLKSGLVVRFLAPRRVDGFSPGPSSGEPPIGWTRDSAAVWSVTQGSAIPSGFPTEGKTLVRISRSGLGAATGLKPSTAGPLDAVQWIRNSDLALAQFGTHGGSYRPSHEDPAPELALIDAARGEILDRLPLDTLRAFRLRNPKSDARYAIRESAAVGKSGRIRAVVTIRTAGGEAWVYWRQGAPAVEVPAPFKQGTQDRIALVPSGELLLNTRELQPDGPRFICEAWTRNCPSFPAPKPRTGPLLELRKFGTGEIVWTVSTTASAFWRGNILEVSPDGGYALTSWPERKDDKSQLALIRLKDGAVEQFVPLGVSGGQAGFTEGGRAIWTQMSNLISIYRKK